MATLLVGPARPYTTIQAAINVTSATNDNPASRAAMDVILVDPGTYTETLDLRLGWLLPVVIRAADPANRPIIASTGAAQAVRADSIYRGTAVGELTLEDLEFSGWVGAGNGVIYITTSGLVVRRCKFTGCSNSRVIRTVQGSATRYGLVDSCEFTTSGATTGLILGNSAYTQVKNCKAVCPTNVPFYSDLGGATEFVEHNSILGTWNSGGNTDVITVSGGTARANILQNLGSGARYGFYEWGAGSYTENVLFGTFSTPFFGTDGGGNQTADPLFANTGTGDLTLQGASPAIRSTPRSANTLLTLTGASRSDPTDAGAYEALLSTTITGATVLSSTSIKLTLAALKTNDATWTTAGNYTISPTGAGAAVTVSAAAVTDAGMSITLTTSEHTDAEGYSVSWAGLTNVTNGSSAYTGAGVAPTLSSVTVTTNQLIRLTFSEAMSSTGLSTAGNYTVAPVSPGGPAITVSSATPGGGNTYVDLVISLGLAGKQYTVTASAALTDSVGNAIGTRAANYTLQKAALLSMTRTINTLVITLSAASDPDALTTLGTWTIARRAPLFGVTPTVSAVALDSPTAPTVVTLTTTNHTDGQNYRVTVASTTGVSAGFLDYTGVGVEVTVTVDGYYFPNNTTVAVWDADTEDWVSALSVTIASDLQVTAVLPYYATGTATRIRVSAGTRHGYKSYTYP